MLCLGVLSTRAQGQLSSLKGLLKVRGGEALPAASIRLDQSGVAAVSNASGIFQLSGIKPGKHHLHIKAIGFKSYDKEIEFKAGEQKELSITLEASTTNMDEVVVVGRTQNQEVNRQAYNVTSVDAKALYNTTLDISSALDRVAGVRVRESGGVGSNFNFSLNGFSGNHVRFFIDGIPMENFGSSFQINNIPVNIAERIEVYKGVVPVWLGSDALGGAVNIVTGDRSKNYIDASYSYGSFNTHRTVVNAAITSKKGLTAQINLFQNYSDNNYKVSVEPAVGNGKYGQLVRLRRFHDTYHNETAMVNVGVVDKPYADKLLLGITLGKNYKEIQTGARMSTVFGGWHRRGNLVMPTLKYRKVDLIPGLDVTLNAVYNLGTEQTIDTLGRRYNWYGGYGSFEIGGESKRTLYKYRNNTGMATLTGNYRLGEHQSIALSNVFNTFNRKGSDATDPNSASLELTRKTNKNILGVAYSVKLFNALDASLFGKHIYQNNEVGDSPNNSSTMNKLGYGTAISYYVTPSFQLRTSYELTNRMPEANEIFGDVENFEGNPGLKPEKSDNFNLGLNYNFAMGKNHQFGLIANGIYRYASNFIFTRFNQNQSKLVADNREGVRTFGGDAELRYRYKDIISAGATATYQYLQNLQKLEPVNTSQGIKYVDSPVYEDQMPNIPYLFGNADVSGTIKNLGGKGNNLSIGYNLLYVHAFWLYWPSQGSPNAGAEKREVPQQLSHDVNLLYSMANGRYNIGLEARNITDALLYDNFSLQKPSRAFYLNLRYFFKK